MQAGPKMTDEQVAAIVAAAREAAKAAGCTCAATVAHLRDREGASVGLSITHEDACAYDCARAESERLALNKALAVIMPRATA